MARELLERLTGGKLRIDRWREKATAQAQVRTEIIDHLFTHLPEVYDADDIDLRADALFTHLYTTGLDDGARVYH